MEERGFATPLFICKNSRNMKSELKLFSVVVKRRFIMKKIAFLLSGCWFCMALITTMPAKANAEILIGTASKDGVYYYAGKAICRMVKSKVKVLSCKSLITPGSLHNLGNLRDGGYDLAIVQSDMHYHAVKGTGPMKFMDGSFENLRALFSLHAEPFTLIVRRDAGIARIEDLAGHRVNIGNPGSGQLETMKVVMQAMGWGRKDFQLALQLNASEMSLALCSNRVQAIIHTVGHPNAAVAKAIKLCDATIAEVNGPRIDKLVADNPYYSYTHIAGNLYAGVSKTVRTFGVRATVMSSSDVPADTVYKIVKAIFDNLESFKKLHPAFGRLQANKMVQEGISAELHEGAKKYFIEKGLL